MEKTKYLIIGNSAGGIGAVEAIRRTDTAGALMVVSDEPYPAYSRPMIAEHLASGIPVEKMLFRPADFYEMNTVKTLLGEKVAVVDFKGQTARLESGGQISWEKLLLATGGVPIVPPLKGIDYNGVFNFITLDDAGKIARFLNRFQHRSAGAVIIGGGLIGVSAAEALVKRGLKVTIVEMKERILNTILDEEASALAAGVLEEAGVHIVTGHTVAEAGSYTRGSVSSAELEGGETIPCSLVIVAIGVRPRLELVEKSDVAVNRGILVDSHMATSVPRVYACGDAAEAYDFVIGERRVTPVWPNAYSGGVVAGSNMAGVPAEYAGGTSLNALKYFGMHIVSAGMVTAPDDSYEVISERHEDIYRKVVLKDGRVKGLIFIGDIEKSGIIYNLMKDGVDVTAFKDTLTKADFGLAALPEALWRSHLEMPDRELLEIG
ncbi:MAG: FAD-dependent oxidoreductase [Chloroflexota bacterium]